MERSTDSFQWRTFCGIPLSKGVPAYSTINKLVNRFGAEAVEAKKRELRLQTALLPCTCRQKTAEIAKVTKRLRGEKTHMKVQQIKSDLARFADPEKAAHHMDYFKACPGGYGEGDRFIGVSVLHQRKIARKYFKEINLEEMEELLRDPVHEYRLTALFILVLKFEKAGDESARQKLVQLYLRNLKWVNNWDLVDSSASHILGAYLYNKDKDILYELAASGDLWQQRVAIVATHYFIKKNQYIDTLKLAKILLNCEHDLIHKATGWMLREVGNRDLQAELAFLKENYRKMPRTMLRYAVEKFSPDLREKFLKGLI